MIRCVLLVLCCGMLLGTSCPGGTTLICSNNLDVSEFGFSVVIPPEFECATTLPNPVALTNVGYRQSSTGILVSVQVNAPQDGEAEDEGVELEDLGDTTTANGFTFTRKRLTLEGIGVSYVAGSELASGNFLFITVSTLSSAVTSQTLLDHLDAIIATVAAS